MGASDIAKNRGRRPILAQSTESRIESILTLLTPNDGLTAGALTTHTQRERLILNPDESTRSAKDSVYFRLLLSLRHCPDRATTGASEVQKTLPIDQGSFSRLDLSKTTQIPVR